MSTTSLQLKFQIAPFEGERRNLWLRRLSSPLWIFLLFAALVRIYLLIHGHGVIDGDEALVGIQAQHILRGEWPLYFYGQAYMGSLEAYLVALLFALFGSSVWVLRAEPLLLSLIVVGLTWRLAASLAKRAALPSFAQKCFVWSATSVSTFLPLYDIIIELHTLGGYIETFVIMLLLLLAALQLMDCWQAGASAKELALRWATIGFLIGLGIWIDPLVIYAVATIIIWIIAGIIKIVIMGRDEASVPSPELHRASERHGPGDAGPSFGSLKHFAPILFVIPAALVGATPALYWGANHHWANIAYILQQGNHQSFRLRILTMIHVFQFYRACLAERVIGGGMPVEDGFQLSLHLWLCYIGIFCYIATALIIMVGLWNGKERDQSGLHKMMKQMGRAITLPFLFGVSTILIFCTSSAATIGLQYPCIQDFVGRYASPILLVLPFFFAATLTVIVLLFHKYKTRFSQIIALIILIFYCSFNIYSYRLADSGYLFQSPYCLIAPADEGPLIEYLQREHIHYAWAVNFVGNTITFKTRSQIIAVDPLGVLKHQDWLNRMPDYIEAVQHADRPSIIVFVRHDDRHPQLLSILTRDHIAYRLARFPAQLGADVIVVTPLNRRIPLLESPQDFAPLFTCAIM